MGNIRSSKAAQRCQTRWGRAPMRAQRPTLHWEPMTTLVLPERISSSARYHRRCLHCTPSQMVFQPGEWARRHFCQLVRRAPLPLPLIYSRVLPKATVLSLPFLLPSCLRGVQLDRLFWTSVKNSPANADAPKLGVARVVRLLLRSFRKQRTTDRRFREMRQAASEFDR